MLTLLENHMIYYPMKYPGGYWDQSFLPDRQGVIYPQREDCEFQAADGTRLHGWYFTPHRINDQAREEVTAEKVILWFHGNAGNITHRGDLVRRLIRLPAQLFIFDYRGYGKSGGKPSEEGLYEDSRAAWRYLVQERGIRADRIVLFGNSLGGAPATQLATEVDPSGLILQSSFTSVPDMAKVVLPFFPRFLVRTQMDSLSKIPSIGCPKLIIHSSRDEVIPYRMGRQLFEAAREPKQFLEVPGATHDDTYLVGGEKYLETIRKFLDGVEKK